MVDAAAMDIKVERVDRVLEEIGAKRNHFTLLLEAWLLRVRLEELQQEMDDVWRRLAELDVAMVYKDFPTYSITNYKTQVVKREE